MPSDEPRLPESLSFCVEMVEMLLENGKEKQTDYFSENEMQRLARKPANASGSKTRIKSILSES